MIALVTNWPDAFAVLGLAVSAFVFFGWVVHCMTRPLDSTDYPRDLPDHDKPEPDKDYNTWTTTTTEIDREEIKRILRELQLERELELAKAAADKNPINQVLKQTAKEMQDEGHVTL